MTNPTVTDELIKELKTRHPGVELNHLACEIDGETFEIIARTPTPGDYNRWREHRTSEDPALKSAANRLVVASSRMWPSPEEWGEMLARKPGLADTFAGELAEAAGIARGARRKKL